MWGDGEQTRSFMFIDDCVEGTIRIMEGDYNLPLNLGTEEMVSYDRLHGGINVSSPRQQLDRFGFCERQSRIFRFAGSIFLVRRLRLQ